MIERKIKYKILFSLLGYGLPLFVGLLTIPWLIDKMGVEVFGLLTLGWTLVGFASVFDLGLGRALTREVSERMTQQAEDSLWSLCLYAGKMMLLSATVVFFVFEAVTPWLMGQVLTLSSVLVQEAMTSVQLLLVSIPIVVASSLLVAVLEGTGQVQKVSLIRVLMGILIFIAPVWAWQADYGLIGVMASLVLARLFGFVGYLLASWSLLLSWHQRSNTHTKLDKRQLLRSGGWMSVSTVMTPILTTLDRFVIGAMLSVSMVAYYATPVDMLMKLQVFSSALMGVVFPAFAATYLSNTQRTVELFSKSLLLIGAVMFAVALSALTLGQLGLTIWLGESFAEQSKWVLYWAALGLFANALSFVPFALLQAIDRADITAKTNLFEMPVYFAFLYWALCEWGIVGAAIASTLRLVMNSLLLFGFSAWLYPAVRKQTQVSIVLMLFGLAVLLVLMGKMDY